MESHSTHEARSSEQVTNSSPESDVPVTTAHLRCLTEDDFYNGIKRHFLMHGKGRRPDLPQVYSVTNGLLIRLYFLKEEGDCSFLELKTWLEKLVPNTASVTESRISHRIRMIIVSCSKMTQEQGVVDVLAEACERLKWKSPSKIQNEAIPLALEGKDVIGLAETGSGKTGAFALPILQALLEKPQRIFALVLTPTRELAYQISEQFSALGSTIGIKCAVIVGGIDMYDQALMLARKPHIIIATPGRLVDHLENTKGFNLRSIKYVVMDEADRILNMDFEQEVDKILKVVPRERRTFLFSATMTKKVQKLQRASLRNPIKVEINTKYKTVDNLVQNYLFIPLKFKDVYLVYILNELSGNTFIIFTSTCNNTQRLALMLRNLGFAAIPLNGQMTQEKRLGALNKFKSKNSSIMIATDVASRGLDIPHVDVVINFDIPTHSKDYIHRVGRTARAGRSGKAISFVSQYDVELYKRIEELIKKQLVLYKTEEEDVMQLMERVSEAQRFTKIELKDQDDKKIAARKRKSHDDDDTEESSGVRKKFKNKKKKK